MVNFCCFWVFRNNSKNVRKLELRHRKNSIIDSLMLDYIEHEIKSREIKQQHQVEHQKTMLLLPSHRYTIEIKIRPTTFIYKQNKTKQTISF